MINSMDLLGRYYTEQKISELLVNQIDIEFPNHILDLGVGNGSLLNAAFLKWENAFYSAVDIEEKNLISFPRLNFIKTDLLKASNEITLSLKNRKIDIAICNPPYSRNKNTQSYLDLFIEISFNNSLKLKYLTTDLLFLAFNLNILKKGGLLGIILPDTLITSHDFEPLRKDLLNYDITSIIELPENVFKKTEAKTYILVLKNTLLKKERIDLYISDKLGNIVNHLLADSNDLVKRMDFTYHSYVNNNVNKGISLNDIGAVITRGQYTKKELEKNGNNFFHTTRFKGNSEGSFEGLMNTSDSYAQRNDLLISRVGSRSVGNFFLITNGYTLYSDCILRVTLPTNYVIPFYNSLKAEYGKNWFKAYSHGVSAKVISKCDLMDYKIPFRFINL